MGYGSKEKGVSGHEWLTQVKSMADLPLPSSKQSRAGGLSTLIRAGGGLSSQILTYAN